MKILILFLDIRRIQMIQSDNQVMNFYITVSPFPQWREGADCMFRGYGLHGHFLQPLRILIQFAVEGTVAKRLAVAH